LILRLRAEAARFAVKIAVTAQHREMLDQVLSVFSVLPDYDLDLMQPGQTLAGLTSRILEALDPLLEREAPDFVIVQGDTTTTMAGAHVEAGLRTGDPSQPFPEEMNRALTGRLAWLHFAPTPRAAAALAAEGIPPERISVTGNTGIDAVLHVNREFESGRIATCSWPWLDPSRRLLLVTGHRRENFGPGFERVMKALAALASRHDIQIVYPVHRNPNVTEPAFRLLAGLANVILLDPLPYTPFVDLMRRSYLIVTDSGGIQEEAPSLGKPVLVLREKTERPEAVEAGTVRLVGTDPERIQEEANLLLDDQDAYSAMARVHNPYGDGKACERIARILAAASNAIPPEFRDSTAK
jgi:UDP-N-acetylglucosamine 2-epimerase (non-hydrolysing)